MSAVARVARAQVGTAMPRPATYPAGSPASPRRPRLRVVPAPRRRAPRTPFIVLVIAMLGGGLMCVLILNTQRAQDAFKLTAIQRHNAQLTDQMQTLRGQVQQDQTPATIVSRAAAIGMEPGGDPAFVDPSGKLLGIGASAVIPLSSGQRIGDLVVIGQAKPKPAPAAAPTTAAAPTATATPSPTPPPSTQPASTSPVTTAAKP